MFRSLYVAGVALAVVIGSPFLSEHGWAQSAASLLNPQDPKKDEPKKDEPKKDEPKKDEPKKDEPKKDDPKKDEPKKDDPKKDDPKKPEEKKADATPPSAPTRKSTPKNSKIKPYDEIVNN